MVVRSFSSAVRNENKRDAHQNVICRVTTQAAHLSDEPVAEIVRPVVRKTERSAGARKTDGDNWKSVMQSLQLTIDARALQAEVAALLENTVTSGTQ